jgi:acetyl esterase/lipase
MKFKDMKFKGPALLLCALAACTTPGLKVSDFKIQKNIVYKKVDGIELSGDIYVPTYDGLKPAVVVVHGGGWDSDAGNMIGISEDLARAGYVVFNIRYRLAPKYLYPAAVEDVRDAVSFLNLHASDYQVNTTKIAGWGYSAGSQLILLVGLDPKNNIKAIVAGGTPSKFDLWPDSPIIKKFIGGTYAEKKDVWEEASPVNHVRADSPPVFLYHGKLDQIVELHQMHVMRDELISKGVKVETYEVPGLGHIPVYLFSLKSIKLGIEFLNRQLTPLPF